MPEIDERVTTTSAVEELSFGVVSTPPIFSGEVSTTAVLGCLPFGGYATSRTGTVMVTVPPTDNEPVAQVMARPTVVHVPVPGCCERTQLIGPVTSVPGSSVSVTSTCCAFAGPPLVTVINQLNGWRSATVARLGVLLMARSTRRRTLVDSASSSLAGNASGSLENTRARLTYTSPVFDGSSSTWKRRNNVLL